ncbi:glycosyltransferase family 2 protein [Patescibacteria group bacterium]|nr:glycosyltransferase family 2 protein [Patescibacteria group bacterium]MCL5798224.1 glycosyltransferase family 2 protein [Patescibacteria group bacterium]
MRLKIAVVILHFRNISLTSQCLQSVGLMKTGNFDFYIILVNNSPEQNFNKNDVGKYLKPGKNNIPVYVIKNTKNMGFAAGINVGIKKALSDKNTTHFLLLNNDTVAPKEMLTMMIKENSDIVSPVIRFKSLENRFVFDFGGMVNRWTGRTTHIESDKMEENKTAGDIDYVSGCCMLIKRGVFEEIGYFDENYFFYYEDTDFCTRAKKAGFSIKVCHHTYIDHKLAGSIGRWSSRAIYYNLTGNAKFISKHLGLRKPIGFTYLFLLSLKILINRLAGK